MNSIEFIYGASKIDIEHYISLIKAILDEEIIQYSDNCGVWRDCNDFDVLRLSLKDTVSNRYRIKPRPKLRPFNKYEIVDLFGKEVINIENRKTYRIVGVSNDNENLFNDEVILLDMRSGKSSYYMTNFLKMFKFTDDKPCGIEE